jgi:hypothetical protein
LDHRRSGLRVAAAALGTLVLVGFAVLSPRVLPYNMDEFVHYHALGCATAPLGKDLPSFRDGCGLYDLRVPFTRTWLPLRSYYYIGSFPSAVFFPFWLALGDPVAARIQGAFFFALFALLAGRLLGASPIFVVLAGLVFPAFALSFIADQGPVGLSAVLLLVALLAGRRSLATEIPSRAVVWAAVAGLTVFVGLWVKLVFAWWLPAVAVFVVAEGRRHHGNSGATLRRLRPAFLAGALALLVPTVLLLAGVDVDGRPYGAALTRGRLSAEPNQLEAGVGRLLPYIIDASELAPRNISLPSSALDVLPAVLGALILVAGLSRSGPRRLEIVGWVILGLVTYGLAATSAFTRWPHHFAFPALFFVLALALALDASGRPARLVAMALVVLLWTSLAVRWPNAEHPRDSSPDKDELLTFVRERGLDRDTFQVHASWGTYYTAQLFGDPARTVVFVKAISDDPRQLQQVACLARERGRRLLLISSRRWPRLQTTHVDDILGRPAQTWRFGDWWAVAYETEGVAGCLPTTADPAEDHDSAAWSGALRSPARGDAQSGVAPSKGSRALPRSTRPHGHTDTTPTTAFTMGSSTPRDAGALRPHDCVDRRGPSSPAPGNRRFRSRSDRAMMSALLKLPPHSANKPGRRG